MILDLFPPGRRDPQGINKAIWDEIGDNDFALPPEQPLTLGAYIGYPVPEALIEPTAVGLALKEMPLFLSLEVYVPVPLEATYCGAFDLVPARWREVLDRPPANPG